MSNETATRLAAIDPIGIEDAGSFDADTLRVIAMQANAMRVQPSVMFNAAVDWVINDGNRPLNIKATRDARLWMPLLCPRRPGWTTAHARMNIIAQSGAVLEIGYRCPPLPDIQWTSVTGTGSLQSVASNIELPPGLAEQRVEVYIRARSLSSSLANAVTIGGPNSITIDSTGDPQVSTTRDGALIGGETYTSGVIDDGEYAIVRVSSGGDDIWTRTIVGLQGAGWLDSSGNNGSRLEYDRRLGATDAANTNRNGGTFEIRTWEGWLSFASLMIVGGLTV